MAHLRSRNRGKPPAIYTVQPRGHASVSARQPADEARRGRPLTRLRGRAAAAPSRSAIASRSGSRTVRPEGGSPLARPGSDARAAGHFASKRSRLVDPRLKWYISNTSFHIEKKRKSAATVDRGHDSCPLWPRVVVVPSCLGTGVAALGVRVETGPQTRRVLPDRADLGSITVFTIGST
jgi:hypothetical protein